MFVSIVERMRGHFWFLAMVLLVGYVLPGMGFAAGSAVGTEGPAMQHSQVELADTNGVHSALRHMYELYSRGDIEALFERATTNIREGMSVSEFRRFMQQKRDRLGPVRSVAIRRLEEGTQGLRATASVTYANGTQEERWTLAVQEDTIRWRSFTTSTPAGEAGSSAEQGGEETVEVGAPVPTFEISALRDSTQAFVPSDFAGQFVLLNFWATWCAPCIEKLPTQRTAAQRYEDAFAILNISFDRSRSVVISFLEDHAVPGRHAFVGIKEFRGSFARQFAIDGIPSPILVGPDGQVVATEGRIESEGLLETLEKEIGAAGNGQ